LGLLTKSKAKKKLAKDVVAKVTTTRELTTRMVYKGVDRGVLFRNTYISFYSVENELKLCYYSRMDKTDMPLMINQAFYFIKI